MGAKPEQKPAEAASRPPSYEQPVYTEAPRQFEQKPVEDSSRSFIYEQSVVTEAPPQAEQKPLQSEHNKFKTNDVITSRDIEIKKEAETVTHDVKPESEQPPKGLYSPRSNIGWEEYTKERLDSELHRCSATEKDLTLILIEFADITNDLMYKLTAEEAVTFFSSRDLLFEYGELGILVILPGNDVDTGISKSERFYQRILEKFPNNRFTDSSLSIGLSSRSGRLINADRLMMETRQAQLKAKEDPNTSIIAFKSDPERYRAFIASQN
jgi:GGDEF domain-containing protein